MEKKMVVGSNKERSSWRRAWRGAKTLFFVITMVVSLFLVCSPPLLIVVVDALLPSALLSSSSFSVPAISNQFKNFDFGVSLVDVPLVSMARSLIILCAYCVWDGRGPYLGITTLCSFLSIGYVSLKAFSSIHRRHPLDVGEKDYGLAMEPLVLSSLALAMAHFVVAYRTSCRQRRKLLVYRIDIEAVSACKNDFPGYHKIALSE